MKKKKKETKKEKFECEYEIESCVGEKNKYEKTYVHFFAIRFTLIRQKPSDLTERNVT